MGWIRIFFMIPLALALTGCTLSDINLGKDNFEETPTAYNLNTEFVQSLDFTTRYLLEMLDKGEKSGQLNVTHLDHNKIKFESKRVGSSWEHLLTFVRDPNGKITNTSLDGKTLMLSRGNVYISQYTIIGENSKLPKLVQLMLKTGQLSSPTFSGSISFSPSQLKENESLDNLYHVSREIVDTLIINRIYQGDTIRDYCTVDETIYLLMVQENKQEYLIWFDGASLTLAGDISFLEEVES